MYKRCLIALFVLLSLCACTSKESSLRELYDFEFRNTQVALKDLERGLRNKDIHNARTLEAYAKQLRKLKPEYASLIRSIEKNAHADGPMYQSLVRRLDDLQKRPGDDIPSLERNLAELSNIDIAAQHAVFNDALSDSVNVLSDLSDGKLPRVQSSSRQAQRRLTGAAYAAPGTQFIGNPQYGRWEEGADGDLLWVWFAAYILFDDILDLDDAFERKRHYRYSRWSSRRPYSYYHDYGRYHYSSPKQINRQVQNENRVAKSFQQKGKRFKSPYAKKSAGGGRLSAASKSTSSSKSSSKSFRSSSSFSSSSRSSSTRVTRGPRLGK